MTNFYTQNCPLCGESAEYCWVDSENRKYFKCDNCTYFQISNRAEELLSGQSQERRYSYASKAPQAPADHLLTIVMQDAHVREKTSDILQATFVPKSELPLGGS